MENRICALPDDLLLLILLLLPTKDAVATTILSKRWRSIWTMLPDLFFEDEGSDRVGWFIDRSLQLHKAPVLENMIVKLGPSCPVDVDVGKWVEKAVNRSVRQLDVSLRWAAKPTSFPRSLYTCDTLVHLTLSNNILVDVTSPPRLPSLLFLRLLFVFYKDENSLLMFLSGCSVLQELKIQRRENDNLKQFTIKMCSLRKLYYQTNWDHYDDDDDANDAPIGSFVLDAPALTYLELGDVWGDFCLIENMPCLDLAFLNCIYNPCDMFLKSLSSVTDHLYLCWTKSMVACNDIKFSWLQELSFRGSYDLEDYLEPLMFLLQNSPILKGLILLLSGFLDLSTSWNQPSTIPVCLSSHLEYLNWQEYGGREDEKQLMRYILANSMCLKKVKISLLSTCNLQETQKELESMPRISTSSQLIFDTPK